MTFYFLPDLENELKAFCRMVGDDKQRIYLRYLYVVNLLLYYKTNFRDLYDVSGVTINRNQLSEILRVPKGKASNILKNLSAWQIIDKVRGFKQGQYSKAFRLNERIEPLAVSLRCYGQNDAPFIRRLIDKKDEKIKESWLIEQQYQILVNRIKINAAGIEYLKGKYENEFLTAVLEDYQERKDLSQTKFNHLFKHITIDPSDIGLLSFVMREIFVVRPDQANRIYTNLTSLKRSHRAFLHLDGKPLLMTDLSNSQVLFSVPVIEDHLKSIHGASFTSKSFDLYKTIALSGGFYEALAAAADYSLNASNRNDFKKAFFREVFFSRPRSKGKVKRTFKKLFPTVAKAINQIKRTNYAEFAIRLQRMEASIFIDQALMQLTRDKIPALSIHDSIVVTDLAHLSIVEKLITETMFDKFGLVPNFKR